MHSVAPRKINCGMTHHNDHYKHVCPCVNYSTKDDTNTVYVYMETQMICTCIILLCVQWSHKINYRYFLVVSHTLLQVSTQKFTLLIVHCYQMQRVIL